MLKKMFQNYDYKLVVSVLLITCFGLIMVYSASTTLKDSSTYYFARQATWVGVSLLAGLFALVFPYKAYKHLVKPITFGTIVLLILVFIIGDTINHAQSWIVIGPISIQPAEIAKLSMIIYLASVFSNKQRHISDFKTSVLPPLFMVITFFLLIAEQPDLGSAMIIAAIAGVVILCSGIRLKHAMILLGSAVTSVAALFTLSLSGEQMSRIKAVGNPFAYAQGDGYQLINSYLAIASGGLIGNGLGESIQKTGYLPEQHTDFIIAIIAEELGFLGVSFVVLCLAFIVIRGLFIGIKCQDVFGSLMAIGISSYIGIQALINLCALTGLIPITGVPLPFVSYGGSSLVMTMFSIGVLINISSFVKMRDKKKENQQEVA